MMENAVQFTLGDADIILKSPEQMAFWIEEEWNRWSWVTSVPPDNGNMLTVFQNGFVGLRAISAQVSRGEVTLQAGSEGITNIFRPGWSEGLIYSQSSIGRAITEIRDRAGDQAALFAYAFSQRRVALADVRNTNQFIGALLLSMPEMGPANQLAQRLRLERQYHRNEMAKALNGLEVAETARAEEWSKLSSEVQFWKRKWLQRGLRRAISAQEKLTSFGTRTVSEITTKSEEAINRINDTDKAFKEAMRLQAPVEYWKEKARIHKIAEKAALGRVLIFFPSVIVMMSLIFIMASAFLIHQNKVEAPLYVIIGAGLATITGMLFWIGRLLTRLYLSEHHLRHDAEERAVMTTTYLALTHEQAAETADRQIILTALFRSTPDGIVKDDGPPDLSAAALLSRFASGKS